MYHVTFIDIEVEQNSKKILSLGGIKSNGVVLHTRSLSEFIEFLKDCTFIGGHNIIKHDLVFLQKHLANAGIRLPAVLDTLYLSPLLFPEKPYHALLKDDKLHSEELNNPLNDARKARELFDDAVTAFYRLDPTLQYIYYLLLFQKTEFEGFFEYLNLNPAIGPVEPLIRKAFEGKICQAANLQMMIAENPLSLAYALALVNCKNRYSVTPRWVVKNYPEVERQLQWLRSNPCLSECSYCNQALDIHRALRRYFGFEAFRTFGGAPLQEQAVQAAVNQESILAVFPTGGGKSITFQVPALMDGENTRGLTVVISPLQSLMKDQVDNLENYGITDAVTINGLLDPVERAKSFERVEDGSASLLYISPESLRSPTIERLLLGRNIARFVIDEAHCFSSWGQDFRVDYLYIGDFIQSLKAQKNLDNIPVSCFTATAKQKVIEDIREYFREKLPLDLKVFRSETSRTNLHYKVYEKSSEGDKYNALRELIEEKNCPTIVYVSRTRKARQLAERLTQDGFQAKPYHGKMDAKEKTANQNGFLSGEIPIMVATSAFGMGVDKKDVGMVIHYEISDSLENYIQEAGRAGRDENIVADCYVLYNEEDLSKHFILLNQTKLNIQEIQQIWKAIKEITRFRSRASNSALEIARKAGWDENVMEIETRVSTAIAALENAGYLKRGQNNPKIYANSILSKTAEEAIRKISNSNRFQETQKENAIRIIKKLFSSKNRKQVNEEVAESRVDHISDHLGIAKAEVINIVNLLREEKILADAKDLTAFIKASEPQKTSLGQLKNFGQVEKFLLPHVDENEIHLNLKKLVELAEIQGHQEVTQAKIKTILNFWAIKHWIKRTYDPYSRNTVWIQPLHSIAVLKDKMEKRHELAGFIIEYLYDKTQSGNRDDENRREILVGFSVHELKEAFERSIRMFSLPITTDDIEDSLFYLSRIESLNIEGGFLVIYNRISIDRLEQDNKVRFKQEDYQQLHDHYENKVQQIHIVGEYAKKMIDDYQGALQFAEDYFQLNYASFLQKYFPGSRRNEIKRNITPSKFRQLFGALSPAQLEIIKDNQTKHMVVAAGPGSGKTRVLVHKLASLLLMEDVKYHQLLMLTFSRASVTDFKKKLIRLIGNAAAYVDIKTFHSYCFDLLGKTGSLEKSGTVIKEAINKIENNEVEPGKITKTVLVIDEAQDIAADEFALVESLMAFNGEMRVIAVGDDDQNIFEFRGASAKYLQQLIDDKSAKKHELVENFRSKRNLVDFSNQFLTKIGHRLKETPIVARQSDLGQIKLIKYHSGNLAAPLVNALLKTDLTGSCAVLTHTNEEALQVTGLLLKYNFPVKLIQSNDGFSLMQLSEIRCFWDMINQHKGPTVPADLWNQSKTALGKKFNRSAKLSLCQELIQDFENTNPKTKYLSDFEVFVRESKIEDFLPLKLDTILVSTIHKAKGREFDNVFLLLDQVSCHTDPDKRLIYVGMTRARQHLSIHLNAAYLDDIQAENLQKERDKHAYASPSQLVQQLTFRDVWLGFFSRTQSKIAQLQSGDPLTAEGDELLNSDRQPVVKFSKSFIRKKGEMAAKGYKVLEARVNFIVYWKPEDSDREIKILLPELLFQK